MSIYRQALAAPFRSPASLICLSAGALPSMAYWWAQNHAVPTFFLVLTLLACFGSAGYSVRVFRAATAGNGEAFELPSWKGDPTDLLKALLAGTLGACAVVLTVAAAIAVLLELFVFLTTGVVVADQATLMLVLPVVLARATPSLAILALPVSAALLGVVAFLPVMLGHYAREDRILAVFEWRRIAAQVSYHLKELLAVLLTIITVVALLNAAFWWSFILLSLIGFTADVIAWALVALVCARRNDSLPANGCRQH